MDKEFTEYRVRPVTRFIVTRADWVEHDNGNESAGSARQLGPEYANADIGYEVAYALARAEAERLGCRPDDMRVIYPQHPDHVRAQASPVLAVAGDGKVHNLTAE